MFAQDFNSSYRVTKEVKKTVELGNPTNKNNCLFRYLRRKWYRKGHRDEDPNYKLVRDKSSVNIGNNNTENFCTTL